MKKHLIFLITIQVLLSVFFLLSALTFLKKTAAAELHTAQNLAGALTDEFPETESAFLRALQNPSREATDKGALLLLRYGYKEEELLSKLPFYRREVSACLCASLAMFLLPLSACLHFLYAVNRRKEEETAALQELLERCLSDDYSFLENAKDALKQETLSDAFLKLANKLRLKSESLAQEKDHTKTLVTDISHQLKTPLAALKTCFALYQEAEAPKEREEFGRRCRFQLEKLESLTASLIHISRLENAMICLQQSTVSLTDVLVDAINGIYEKALSKEITIDVEEFSDIRLFLDRKWTAEALFNLLDNAVKYSPTGSLVTIRVQPLYSFVRVEIEDQGIGIPRKEYNKIFKRFYRSPNETVQQTEGTGVGLYLSREILERQGGTLSVKAPRHQGSIFVVQLPL